MQKLSHCRLVRTLAADEMVSRGGWVHGRAHQHVCASRTLGGGTCSRNVLYRKYSICREHILHVPRRWPRTGARSLAHSRMLPPNLSNRKSPIARLFERFARARHAALTHFHHNLTNTDIITDNDTPIPLVFVAIFAGQDRAARSP